jgi:hypothetical protein
LDYEPELRLAANSSTLSRRRLMSSTSPHPTEDAVSAGIDESLACRRCPSQRSPRSVKYLFVDYHFLVIPAHRSIGLADLEGSLEDNDDAIAAQAPGPTAQRRIAGIG